ncbi:extracellular solute-binding protein [Paenibacillus agricola]|uniref:Extracellular solute-binding protein n=1 Tax=Paenibacillus agricola TaxID=2716264 RepID=A0ABX0J8T4_9BACL|nr:extracellular solute-binding protein [Paenibacillus agricola]NHN32378.1 extracellular solute-binding protein [Paenibacillus agricola]
MNIKGMALIAAALSLAIAGCSKQAPAENTAATTPAKVTTNPVEISLWTGYPELDPWFKIMTESYQKEHPNVKVNISSFPLKDFEKKISTAIPSNSAADIISVNPSLALRYVQTNMIQKAPDDLSAFVKSGIFPEVVVKDAVFNNAVYGIPHMMANAALFYNKKMFAEAGLTEPPKTMDQLVEYAKKLTKYDAAGKVERSGLSLRLTGGGSGVAEKFWVMQLQNGGTFLKEVSPGKYKPDYNNESGLKTFQMYVDMVHKYKTDDPVIKHDAEAFEMEKTAMLVRESWVIGDIKQKAPNLDYGTATLPAANIVVEKDFYVTNSAKGDKATAAWDFIRFLMEQDNHKQQLTMTGWHPVRDDLKLDDVFKETPQLISFFAKYNHLEVYPSIPEHDELQTKFADRLANKGFTDPSLVGNVDKMKAILAEAEKETIEILKKAGHLAE